MIGMYRVLPVLAALLLAVSPTACSKDKEAPKPVSAPAQQAKPVPTVKEVFNRAVTDLRENRLDQALSGFSLIIEKAYPGAPERAFSYAYMGQIAFRAGKMDVAIQNFESALKESPEMTPTRMALGNAYFSVGRVDDAITAWEKLVKANPNLPTVHNNLGVAYLEKKRPDKAIQHLEQTIALAPENARAHANLADAYRQKGMEKAAQAAERKVAAIRARSEAKAAGRAGG